MDNPFLTPYPPSAPGAAPGLKPFAADDLAPAAGQAAPRPAAAPQASPFLDKNFSQAFLPRAAPPAAPAAPAAAVRVEQPVPIEPDPEPLVLEAFAAEPAVPEARFTAPIVPIAPMHPFASSPTSIQATPAAPPAAPAAASPAAPRPALAPMPAPAPSVAPRSAAGTGAFPKSTLAMTDSDAGPAAPTAPAFPVTTGPSLEGRRIHAYLGVVSVEIVIPKDVLFRNPAPYGELHRIKAAEEQLQRVKQKAFEELAERARALGANGITGASLQFSQFDAVVFLCAALGTAVKIGD